MHHSTMRFSVAFHAFALLAVTGIGTEAAETKRNANMPDAERTAAWAAMLPEQPHGVGEGIGNRQAWRSLGKSAAFREVVSHAEKLLAEPMPVLSDDLYLDYFRTGKRAPAEAVISQRTNRFATLVTAECLEDKGRFLPAIEEAINVLCNAKTWVLPAHDRGQANFAGKEITIDLRSAATAWNLATARRWLGDRLSKKAQKQIDDELERRIFQPFTSLITKSRPAMWWLHTTNNWNAVCLAGVVGAAMADIESRDRRAFFAAAAELHVKNFLSGFTPDGYCSEGLGYWNYGFGHYVMLAETLRQATGGKVDWLSAAAVRNMALFGRRMEVLPGVYPAFADCHLMTQPDVPLMAFLSRRYGWGLDAIERQGLGPATGPHSQLFALGLFAFPNSVTDAPEAKALAPTPLHDWFPDAGVFIGRPSPGSSCAFGVALKGGHNAEHHNHNDIGSFMVAHGRATPLVDPGKEVYTSRTFGLRRYDSKVLNSFGHPVPQVAGQLQQSGRQAAASVVKTEFTNDADTIVLDLTTAYKVKALKKLERTFVYSRGSCKLTVRDTVEFDSPQTFGTALITFDPWKQLDPAHLRVGNATDGVTVAIGAEGGQYRVEAESIQEQLPDGRIPIRIGIDFVKPVTNAVIEMNITP
jgi:hypothetical protein